MSNQMYMDISHTVTPLGRTGERRHIDPHNLEVLFLNEVVDNPSNTLSAYKHHYVPTLGRLPAAFSSTGSVLDSQSICEVFLNEHASQSESEISLGSYPMGSDYFIQEQLDNIISFVLHECDDTFSKYTRPLIESVYGLNFVFRWLKPDEIRQGAIDACTSKSSIKSAQECVDSLKSVVNILSHVVDVTESMKLPLRITSRLFSRMSILFSIPTSTPTLTALNDYLSNAPEMVALEAWCCRINAGCKLWDDRTLTWRRRKGTTILTGLEKESWLEWLGLSPPQEVSPPTTTPFKANKSHNILFAMASVSAMFVYVALVLNSGRK